MTNTASVGKTILVLYTAFRIRRIITKTTLTCETFIGQNLTRLKYLNSRGFLEKFFWCV